LQGPPVNLRLEDGTSEFISEAVERCRHAWRFQYSRREKSRNCAAIFRNMATKPRA